MEINPKTTRQWSRLGTRGFFGQAILSIADQHPELMVMSADLASSSGLERFKSSYPQQFINAGIAEQNMIGVASGLAKEGFNVFATSFSPFISMRASEQVRMNMGYMQLNVKAVSIGSGVGMGFLGNSHFGIEDAAVMRSIPNLTVINPADCAEVLKTVQAAANFSGPIYIRLTGTGSTPVVYQEDYSFSIGTAITLREGIDTTLIASGSMVHESLQAAEALSKLGVSARVINMHTIKPLDYSILDKVASEGNPFVTVEEHSVIGGLGSAVAEYMCAKKIKGNQLMIGIKDEFVETGSYQFMLNNLGLTGEKIAKQTYNFLAE